MSDKRRDERVRATLPVSFGGVRGTTCDVSASGVFFETNASFSVGEQIRFVVEFDGPGGPMLLRCSGAVVRTERRDQTLGVAVVLGEAAMAVHPGGDVLQSSCSTAGLGLAVAGESARE